MLSALSLPPPFASHVRSIVAGGLLSAMLMTTLAAGPTLAAPPKGGAANLAMVAEPQTLDPMASTADLVGTIMQHVYEPLYTFDGNWTVAIYVDEHSNDQQAEALGAIFGGAEGGPMAAFAPMIATNLGVKKVPITYRVTGKTRSAEIPGIMHMAVEPLPTLRGDGEMWASAGHPIAPDRLAMAVGGAGSTFTDLGMRWDNSGKNGHYAPISWSNQ